MVVAGVVVLAALVAGGVSLGVLQLQSRTNPQTVNLRSGVTISEDSAIVQAAARAKPAVVSVVTQLKPAVSGGAGYLATSDGFIVTNVQVIAHSSTLTVLLLGDTKPHKARLVDYDCQTGVAVLKVDQVSGLPTLAFADPTSLVQGQVVVALAGPLTGSAMPGHVSALHRPVTVTDSVAPDRTVEISDTIQTDVLIDASTAGGPLLNVGGQVIAVSMAAQGSNGGFGLNPADIQDEVQQVISSGQLVVASLGGTSTVLTEQAAALTGALVTGWYAAQDLTSWWSMSAASVTWSASRPGLASSFRLQAGRSTCTSTPRSEKTSSLCSASSQSKSWTCSRC